MESKINLKIYSIILLFIIFINFGSCYTKRNYTIDVKYNEFIYDYNNILFLSVKDYNNNYVNVYDLNISQTSSLVYNYSEYKIDSGKYALYFYVPLQNSSDLILNFKIDNTTSTQHIVIMQNDGSLKLMLKNFVLKSDFYLQKYFINILLILFLLILFLFFIIFIKMYNK